MQPAAGVIGTTEQTRQYTSETATVASFGYDYDAPGNKLYLEDLRDSALSELYGYDQRDRLTSWERGQLSGDKTNIPGPTAYVYDGWQVGWRSATLPALWSGPTPTATTSTSRSA